MSITPETVSFILSLIAIGGLIWRTATESERIKSSIKDVRDELRHEAAIRNEQLMRLIERLEIQTTYNKEAITHKSQRFESDINSLKGYLQKKFDFKARHFRDDDDNGPSTGPL